MTKWTDKHPPQNPECPERFRSFDAWRKAIGAEFEALDRYFIEKETLNETKIQCYSSIVEIIEGKKSGVVHELTKLRKKEYVTDKEEIEEQKLLALLEKHLMAYFKARPRTTKPFAEIIEEQQKKFNAAKMALGNVTPPKTYDEIEINYQKTFTLEYIDALESGDRDKLRHLLLNNIQYLHPDVLNKSYEPWLSPQEKQEQPKTERETKVRFSDEVTKAYYEKGNDESELYQSTSLSEETKWQKKEEARQQDDKKSILKKSIQ